MKVNRSLRYKLFYAVALLVLALAAGPIGVQTRVGGLMAVAILLLLQVGSAAIISATSCAAAIWPVKPGSKAIDAGTAFLEGLPCRSKDPD
jgi:hypothetical protein